MGTGSEAEIQISDLRNQAILGFMTGRIGKRLGLWFKVKVGSTCDLNVHVVFRAKQVAWPTHLWLLDRSKGWFYDGQTVDRRSFSQGSRRPRRFSQWAEGKFDFGRVGGGAANALLVAPTLPHLSVLLSCSSPTRLGMTHLIVVQRKGKFCWQSFWNWPVWCFSSSCATWTTSIHHRWLEHRMICTHMISQKAEVIPRTPRVVWRQNSVKQWDIKAWRPLPNRLQKSRFFFHRSIHRPHTSTISVHYLHAFLSKQADILGTAFYNETYYSCQVVHQ